MADDVVKGLDYFGGINVPPEISALHGSYLGLRFRGKGESPVKIIEAMKRIKHLQEKAADLRAKVAQYCADVDFETAAYPDQKGQIDEWLQSHADTVQEIAGLRVAISRTNLATSVTIELGNKQVTKTLAEWIHRRKDLAKLDFDMWSKLGDRNLKEGVIQSTTGGTVQVKIRRYFDPKKRDEMMAIYKSEPAIIDGHLEVTNAVTDLVEA